MEGAVRTLLSLKTIQTPLANVIVRVGSARMGCSGGGAEIDEGIDGRRGPMWMGEDACIAMGPGADPGS